MKTDSLPMSGNVQIAHCSLEPLTGSHASAAQVLDLLPSAQSGLVFAYFMAAAGAALLIGSLTLYASALIAIRRDNRRKRALAMAADPVSVAWADYRRNVNRIRNSR